MTARFKDHFSERAAQYALWRPGYPAGLARLLAELAPSRELALDCGCGSGQFSRLLAREFRQVVGIDASAAQIGRARAAARVHYRTAPAEHSGLDDASVDLLTAAQAAHWFALDAFYAEARRVLRRRGCVALISYGLPRLHGEVGELVLDLHDRVLGPYWPPERRHVVDGYRNLPFPFDAVATPSLHMQAEWTLAQLLGYIGTWSALRAAEAALGGAALERFEQRLRAAWGEPQATREVSWPLSLRVGHAR